MPDASDSGLVAAIDLGSNSFHLIIGRELHGEFVILDRLRDPVRLAAGLDDSDYLDSETLDRMLASLRRFGQRVADIPRERVRAIGTNTFRKAKGPKDLLGRASTALGSPIEVLSGHEEARLIYLGVAHDQPHVDGRRLVVDIGGGSTECILGEGARPLYLESLYMGCVSSSMAHFPDGVVTKSGFRRAELAAKIELETIERRFKETGWSVCIGSSGTVNAASSVLRELGFSDGAITLDGLKRVRKILVRAGSVSAAQLAGLQPERTLVIAGGLAILKALMETMEIEEMRPCKAALREGVLYDLLGRIHHEDARDRTIRTLAERYHLDEEQAARVESTALRCLTAVAGPWELGGEEPRQLLGWAARMHEVGLAIAYSSYHKHGAYILENSNMPGFSRQEQSRLATLVRGHRRKLVSESFRELTPEWSERVLRLSLLLRLAVRLNRTRSTRALPDFEVRAKRGGLGLVFPADWLTLHPLTRADLAEESRAFATMGYKLECTQALGPAAPTEDDPSSPVASDGAS